VVACTQAAAPRATSGPSVPGWLLVSGALVIRFRADARAGKYARGELMQLAGDGTSARGRHGAEHAVGS
jgi:hypothetical protein